MKQTEKTLYLYDPRTNILSETTYSKMIELTGFSKANLASYKCRCLRINSIGCYLTDDIVTLKQRKAWYEKENFHNETWKSVIGSGGDFHISNYGRFKRIFKNCTRFLMPILKKKAGCLEIKVRFNGVYDTYRIAKLVALHFIGKPAPGQVLHHKNGIKTDNYHGNLEYISRSDLGKKTGRKSKSREVVQLDRFTGEVLGEYTSAREASRKCFLSKQSVIDCCNGKSKSSGGIYVFKWADQFEEDEGLVI